MEALRSLTEEASRCVACKLSETRRHVVFGRGNAHSGLMIVGEAPGTAEDETARPFVGKSGLLLDRILSAADIDPERDVYICYAVKCHPPGNRPPERGERASCLPLLQRQIEIIKPRLILLAGTAAVQAVLQVNKPISKIRGQWFEIDSGARVMPIFHPSYLLRNDSKEPGSPKWHMWQDIRSVKNALRALSS